MKLWWKNGVIHTDLMNLASANSWQLSVWYFQLQVLKYVRNSLLRENSLSVLNQEVPATHMPSEVHELNWQIKQLSENMRKAMEELCPNIDFPIEV